MISARRELRQERDGELREERLLSLAVVVEGQPVAGLVVLVAGGLAWLAGVPYARARARPRTSGGAPRRDGRPAPQGDASQTPVAEHAPEPVRPRQP